MHYVDRSVQRSLLVAMVALEVILVVAATWQLHWHLNELIEKNLYRVHLADAGPTLIQLVPEAFGVLSVFFAVNVLALLIAEGIWRRHSNQVIGDFSALIDKMQRLDFSGDGETHRQHEVLDKALAWRAGERARFVAIREQFARLEAAAAGGRNLHAVEPALHELRRLVWPAPMNSAEIQGSGAADATR